jgi:hypothetical protein
MAAQDANKEVSWRGMNLDKGGVMHSVNHERPACATEVGDRNAASVASSCSTSTNRQVRRLVVFIAKAAWHCFVQAMHPELHYHLEVALPLARDILAHL